MFDERQRRCLGRIEHPIGDAVVHGGQAGGAHIGQVGDLHRRRLAGEQARTAIAGIHGEVDQQVDAIGADQIGQGAILELVDIAPVLDVLGDLGGEAIFEIARRVGEHLKLAAVVVFEHRQQEPRYRMHPEIGRDIAHPQPAPSDYGTCSGSTGSCFASNGVKFRLAEALGFGGQLGVAGAGAVVEGE